MSDNSAVLCPWCQMEIVWDEEIGPEESCPHCFNELNEYRSLHVELDGDELELKSSAATDKQPLQDDELSELGGYELAVRQRLEQQEDILTCSRCGEEMALAGSVRIDGDSFVPMPTAEGTKPFIQPPFHVEMHVCPSCFQIGYTLADDDRLRLMNEWSGRPD